MDRETLVAHLLLLGFQHYEGSYCYILNVKPGYRVMVTFYDGGGSYRLFTKLPETPSNWQQKGRYFNPSQLLEEVKYFVQTGKVKPDG